MKFSVYLHKPIADVLRCYGDLSEVTNRILSLADEGVIDVFNKPDIPNRDGAARYTIDVTNEGYLALLNTYSANSKHISLRRLLYWFVENELYYEVGWKVVNEYRDAGKDRAIKRLDSAYDNITRVKTSMQDSYVTSLCDELLSKLNIIKEVIKNG